VRKSTDGKTQNKKRQYNKKEWGSSFWRSELEEKKAIDREGYV